MTTNVTVPERVVTRILHLPITCDAEAFATVARESERVLVQLGTPGGEHRDALDRFVASSIESQLAQLGAAPPSWRAGEALASILRDQLYRARLLGCSGIALRFEALSELADDDGQLGPEDSATLRQLVAIAGSEPLQLYLPERCATLHVAGHPQPLSAWLPPSREPGRVATIEYDPIETSTLAEPPLPSDPQALLAPPQLEAFLDSIGSAEPDAPTPEPALEPPAAGSPEREGEANAARALVPAASVAAAEPSSAGPAATGAAVVPPEAPAPVTPPCMPAASAAAAHLASSLAAPAPSDAAPAEAEAASSADDAAALEPIDPARIERSRSWAAQLQTMSGPKAHGSVEKAFIGAYLPLCREVACGAAPAEAQAAAERWAEGFAQSYASAFRQLPGGTRRPRMVKDVVDVAVRWLGQYHARQCQLLLVSAMRYDLGERLNEELQQRLSGAAACVDDCVLWAALPSNAEAQQLGADPPRAGARPAPAVAGGAPAIESMSVGNRELFKLNHVPGDLPRAGEVEGLRLGRLARELADVIEPWIRRQPPDTLIVVFGDHGYHWQSTPIGTSAAQRGGALPEQVLVPASAWLLPPARVKPRLALTLH